MPPKKFNIRDFVPSDMEELWQIDQKCFQPGVAYSRAELAWYIRQKSAFTLVAETEEDNLPQGSAKIAGFLVADRNRRNVGHLITIDVLPEFRRRHLASTLLTDAEERLRSEGCSLITLETAVDNTAAIAFYMRRQYMIQRTLPRYYTNGVDALRMVKPL